MPEDALQVDFDLKYKRALLFLQFAIEELRDSCPPISQKLRSFYTNEMSFLFAIHLRPDDYNILTNESHPRVRALLSSGRDFFDAILKNLRKSTNGPSSSSVSGSLGSAGADNAIQTAVDDSLALRSSPQDKHTKDKQSPPYTQFGKRSSDPALPSATSFPRPAGMKSLPYRGVRTLGFFNLDKNGNIGEASLADAAYNQTLPHRGINKGIALHASAPRGPLPQGLSASSPSIGDGHAVGKSGRSTIEEFDAYLRGVQERDRARSLARRLVIAREKSPGPSTATPSASIVQSNYSAWKENWAMKSLTTSSATTKERSDRVQPQNTPADNAQEQKASPGHVVDKNSPPEPKTGTWAKVAAIAKSEAPRGPPEVSRELISWSAAPAPSSPIQTDPLLLNSPRLSYDVGVDGQEPFESQLRVVWLYDIPSSFTALQVSRHITTGPLFSLSMERNVAEHLPGLSACIIFQISAHAKAFLLANGCSVVFHQDGEAGEHPAPETTQIGGLHNRYHREAPSAVLQLGNPYPVSNHNNIFQSMLPPYMARRRVKWARSRLFHSVPIATFKRDILRLVEGRNLVELWHFYNPGECTVVFASVGVAVKVVEVFKYWAAGKAKYLAKHSSSDVEKIKVEGRYVGTEVAFCKDFNETPPNKIISSYGTGNSLGTGLPGYEGLYEGPRVKPNGP